MQGGREVGRSITCVCKNMDTNTEGCTARSTSLSVVESQMANKTGCMNL